MVRGLDSESAARFADGYIAQVRMAPKESLDRERVEARNISQRPADRFGDEELRVGTVRFTDAPHSANSGPGGVRH